MKKILILLLLICLLSGCTNKSVFKNEISEDTLSTVSVQATTNGTLSNEKIGWGLKKNKNAPPEIPSYITDVLEKYGAIYKDSEPRSLYLTFDEGYENGYTEKILDVLKENKVPAAFFVTMPYLKKEEMLIKRMVDEGHIVGNHTVNHPSMPSVTDDDMLKREITDLSDEFKKMTKKEMKFIRPPMGEYSERTLKISKDLGLTSVFWSFAYLDWDVNNQSGTDYAYTQISDGIHDGAILLLHAVSRDNAEVLDKIIKDFKSKGYRFKSLDDFGKKCN